jgi:hypothetical protein
LHSFKPKILIWVTLGGLAKEMLVYFWSFLRPLGIFCVPLVYFMSGSKFTVLVCCTKKNMATL